MRALFGAILSYREGRNAPRPTVVAGFSYAFVRHLRHFDSAQIQLVVDPPFRVLRHTGCRFCTTTAKPNSTSSTSSPLNALNAFSEVKQGVTAATPPADSASEAYVFPVGRALRLLRRGRWWQSARQPPPRIDPPRAENAITDNILTCAHRFLCEESDNNQEDQNEHHRIEEEDFSFTSAQERDETQAAAARFVTYHSHHLLTSYRRGRRVWSAPPHPSSTSVVPMHRLLELLFAATLLLRLGALYESAGDYLEGLLDVCLSVTVFLSRAGLLSCTSSHDLDATLSAASTGSASLTSSTSVLSSVGATTRTRGCRWNSLRWAVVHFCEAVRLWRLCDHAAPLFHMETTRRPFARLLQGLTACLLSQLPRGAFVDSLNRDEGHGGGRVGCSGAAEWARLQQIAAGSPDSSAVATWFGESPEAFKKKRQLTATAHPSRECQSIYGIKANKPWDGRNNTVKDVSREAEYPGETSAADAVAFNFFAQQRRLQLLPMVWLALLIGIAPLSPPSSSTPSSSSSSCLSKNSTSEAKTNAAALSRYAFLALLPLFSYEAAPEGVFWGLAELFYAPSPPRVRAGVVEVAVLLSAMERHGPLEHVWLRNDTAPLLSQRMVGRVTRLLRRWAFCGVPNTMPEQQMQTKNRLLSPSSSRMVRLDARGEAVATGEPVARTLSAMYGVFTNLPHTPLMLLQHNKQHPQHIQPLSQEKSSEDEPWRLPFSPTSTTPRAVEFDGMAFLTVLLRHVLRQSWQGDVLEGMPPGAVLVQLRRGMETILSRRSEKTNPGGERGRRARAACGAELLLAQRALQQLQRLHTLTQRDSSDAAMRLGLLLETAVCRIAERLGTVVFARLLRAIRDSTREQGDEKEEEKPCELERELLARVHESVLRILLHPPQVYREAFEAVEAWLDDWPEDSDK